MAGEFIVRVFDVEHGACAMMLSPTQDRLAMVDCGHNTTTGWKPSTYLRNQLGRTELDYLFVTNADQDHLSDLDGLWQHGIKVKTLIRNRSPNPDVLRSIKLEQGELTNDVERFLDIHTRYTAPASIPFDVGMGGVTCKTFSNKYPKFAETNNLSLAVFIEYCGFKILFPGDLEKDGWKALLEDSTFRSELAGVNVFTASHHGRENGYCEDVFNHCTPQVVVISDKPIVHSTQEMVPDYRRVVGENGVSIINQIRRRHVLTTRRDGDICFKVTPTNYYIETAISHS